MNLFIDTNVLLSFYHLTDDDIEELKKLVALVKHGQITLWTTTQVADEFARNRDSKIKDALKDFNAPSWRSRAPAFLKDYPEYLAATQFLKEASKRHSALMIKANADIKAENLAADSIIRDLRGKATTIEVTPPLFGKGIERMRAGNPPGKSGITIGDEINWECLLLSVPNGQDLHIVSTDKDYAAPLDEDALHPFLASEWASKKASTARYYSKLSSFFGEHFKQIKLASEVDRRMAIQRLGASGSFYSTHIAIAQLNGFTDFTLSEIEDLIEIAMVNGQVGGIMTDDDVGGFYVELVEDNKDKIDPEKLKMLNRLLFP
ncbi:PIN domain-containing protein [Mesorhizobium sp. M1342]|uniref:PIN domain-containing protein n=1 Tax=Mesorhizobium sp. M1342 TaxID=2957088 RepID=UPI00333CA4B0